MIPSNEEQAVRGMVRMIVSDWDTDSHEVPVIFANQPGPKPCKPFLTIDRLSITGGAQSIVKRTDEESDDEFIMTITTHYRATFSIRAFGDGNQEMVQAIIAGLERIDVRDYMDAAQVYPVRVPLITSLDQPLDDSWEHISIVDLEVAFARQHDATYQDVRTIEVDCSLGNFELHEEVEL